MIVNRTLPAGSEVSMRRATMPSVSAATRRPAPSAVITSRGCSSKAMTAGRTSRLTPGSSRLSSGDGVFHQLQRQRALAEADRLGRLGGAPPRLPVVGGPVLEQFARRGRAWRRARRRRRGSRRARRRPSFSRRLRAGVGGRRGGRRSGRRLPLRPRAAVGGVLAPAAAGTSRRRRRAARSRSRLSDSSCVACVASAAASVGVAMGGGVGDRAVAAARVAAATSASRVRTISSPRRWLATLASARASCSRLASVGDLLLDAAECGERGAAAARHEDTRRAPTPASRPTTAPAIQPHRLKPPTKPPTTVHDGRGESEPSRSSGCLR